MTSSYKNSFFADGKVAIATARAGNVIGGGDFALDRIIPDCVRAAASGKDIIVRNPYSIRPYQHVLEPVYAYLLIAMNQYENGSLAGSYNVGPDDCDCITTGELVTLFCDIWKSVSGNEVKWVNQYDGGPHEANCLKLDCSKMKNTFGWKPNWNIEQTMRKLVEWYYCFYTKSNIKKCMVEQIRSII